MGKPFLYRVRNLVNRQSVAFLAAAMMLVLAFPVTAANAAALTTISDTMSRLKQGVASNHTIQFITPTGVVATSQNITLTFPSGFDVSTIVAADVDIAVSAAGTCASFTDRTVTGTSGGADTWGVSISSQVITLHGPTSGTIGTSGVPAGRCVQVEIGTNATTGSTGTHQITNHATPSSYTIAIAGTFGDTGSYAIAIISEDTVSISATVDPTLTFKVDQSGSATLAFGTLSTSATRWATNGGGSGSETSGHVMRAATNATSGYVITVQGATLTSGANTIPAITTAGGLDPTAGTGTSQFGEHLSASGGSGTVDADYSGTGPNKYFYGGTASVADTVAASTGPSANTDYTTYYASNISPTQQAGSYTAALTYICTATY